MAATAEGAVKKLVKALFKNYEPELWYFMVVPGGFGVGGLPDFIGLYKGRFFGVETKAPGRRGQINGGLSGLQVLAMNCILTAGGAFFKVDDAESLKEVEAWLNQF